MKSLAGFAKTEGDLATGDRFRRFADFVTERLGIKMPEAKRLMLHGRITRRMRQLRMSSIEEYEQYLFHSPYSPEECVLFMDAVTTNKTDFFREPDHYDYLLRHALPSLSNGQSGFRRVAVWSAGCASGEEPYTLAMVMSEFARMSPGFDFRVLATDISTRVLAQGQRGIYESGRVEGVPHGFRQRYLLRDPSGVRVRVVPELRARIAFHRLNLMDPAYPITTMFSAIFFRNVMIYFDRKTQERVVNKLCRHLKNGGYFYIGHAESITGFNTPLKQVAQAVFRKGSEPGHPPAL